MKPKIKTTCTKLQLQLLSFCLLCLSGKTRCDGNGPAVVTVEQGSDAVLPCSLSSKENIEFHLFDWKKPAQIDGGQKKVFYYDAGIHYNNGRAGQSEEFKGRVSHFPEELKHGNASIIIRNTTVADSGNYTCVFPNLQPRQTFHIDLVVAKKPFITTLEQTKDWSRLQCEVQGASPKPKVEWKDSSGNILPAEKTQVTDRGGSYDIILQTTVTKTDYYHCVVTQGENHQIEAKINVHISGSVLINTCDDDDTRGCWENDCGGVEPCTPHMNPHEALHVKKKKEKKKEEKGHVSTLSLTKDDVDTIKDFLSRCQYHAGWEKTKALCSGCKISHPSQRRHSCLFEFDQIRCMYFDQILDSVFKQSLGKALHYLFAQISPGAFSQDRLLGAAETLRHYLRPGCDGISANEEMETAEDHKHETALRNAFTVWTKCCCCCISTDL